MKKVLIISYYYPPMPAVGGLRAQGLVKYLPEFGWQPTVVHGELATRGTLVHKLFAINPNQNLLAQAEELKRKIGGLPIDHLLKLYAEYFAYPDTAAKWGAEIINTKMGDANDFDAIISTSSPVSCHTVASAFKHEYDIPWIADFRDLWTLNHYYPYSRRRKAKEMQLELETLRYATALTTVSEPLSVCLSQFHHRFVHTILNGYDPQELNQGTPLTEEFTITHTGNIYKGKQNPEELFKTWQGKDVLIRFYGTYYAWIDTLAKKYGMENKVKQYGWVSHKEALQRQRESRMLLYLKWNDPEQEGIYGAKLFEYLATKRPIISIGRADSYVDKVITDANWENIEPYSQRVMASKFADLLDQKGR